MKSRALAELCCAFDAADVPVDDVVQSVSRVIDAMPLDELLAVSAKEMAIYRTPDDQLCDTSVLDAYVLLRSLDDCVG